MEEKVVKEPKEPSRWSIGLALGLAALLSVLAVVIPIGAWFGLLMPESRTNPDWFMRSGAVTAIFAFAAQEQTANAIAKLSSRAAFGSKKIDQLRKSFIEPLNKLRRYIFWLAIVGSAIWAYGDIAMVAVQS
ncbi:hypothetical protein [Pseudomonas sp. zfem002]|uniref:hypothetical protein n=1 Tax=Pseudomonas sp. zfem002 TaxID=3078197 RepID=UPI002929CD37|nr:hypothetical protein [Pseudomonas sp. zfem002]MDU9391884.1 hypothetical protein [Pseudomonas sp. zfem002]